MARGEAENPHMITIREFTDQTQAGLIQSFLKDNEIDSILADDNANSWVGARMLVPIRLQVPEGQAGMARSLLAQFDAASTLSDGNDMPFANC